jgi:hypothetical protein
MDWAPPIFASANQPSPQLVQLFNVKHLNAEGARKTFDWITEKIYGKG